jgi:tetratricopeptide (TPR) repeat protein
LTIASESLRLNPKDRFAYQNVAEAYQRLGRYDEAKAVAEQAIAQNSDSFSVHAVLYNIAFIRGDAPAMQREMAWAAGKPEEPFMLFREAMADYTMGRAQRARATLKHVVGLAEHQGLKAVATNLQAAEIGMEAMLGNTQGAAQKATELLAASSDRDTRMGVASVLAFAGDSNQAERIVQEVAKDFPLDTLLNSVSIPSVRAIIEIKRHNPARAIALLEVARPYDLIDYGVMYFRGEAHLQARDGAKAAAEYQKILDHRGIDPLDPVYSLARLGLGRALALQGQTPQARTAYQDFLAFWKDADPDLPVLKQAKEEYEKLR